MNEYDLLYKLNSLWLYIVIAAVGGVLGHMMRRVRSQQIITVGETALQGVVAAFAGFLVLLGCRSLGVPSDISGVLVGLCGWLGGDASLMLMQSYVCGKLKIRKEKVRDDERL